MSARLAAFLVLAASTAFAASPETVSIPTDDGLSLSAVYAPPAPGKGVLVLLHGLDSSKEEWRPFSAVAVKDGWGTLAYDARGHGRSVRGTQRGFRTYGPGGPGTEWERMPADVGAVLRYLNGRGVATSSVAVIGASLGANVAARFAARGAPIRALVLLSPGLNYLQFRPDRDLAATKAPRLLVAHPSDRYAHVSALKLANATDGALLWTDVPPGHGVQMFDAEGAFARRLLDWIGRRP